ncbi:Zinc finger and BTB domain-containing protein 49, partial [Frankliniella fusca]
AKIDAHICPKPVPSFLFLESTIVSLMQSHTGKQKAFTSIRPLRCADCDDNHDFTSAASLLSHFAQHIITAEAGSHLDSSSTSCTSKKKKSESLMEQILQRTSKRVSPKKRVGSSGSGPPRLLPLNLQHIAGMCTPPLLRFFHKKVEPGDPEQGTNIYNNKEQQDVHLNQSSSCSSASSTSSTSSMNGRLTAKILNGSSVNLAKFDMQERLENCVLNLVSKRDIKRSVDRMIPDLPPLIPTKKLYTENCESWDCTSAGEEINPLTLCTVTIDDCENGTDIDEIKFDMSKKSGNRKQLAPKKISRQENDVIQELTSKLPEHTTLTSVDCPSPEREKPVSKKRYPCHICSKVFGWSTDLKRHILIHTGERPFKCKLCPSSFTRNFLLQKHESKVHNRSAGRFIVNGQLDAISLKLQSDEQKEKLISLLPSLETPFDISSKPLADTSEEEAEVEGDDRSSADENDNHNQKINNLSLEVQDPCRMKQNWPSPNLAQQALQ